MGPSALVSAPVAFAESRSGAENSHGEAALLRMAELASEFGAENVAADGRSVAERVSEGRFFVACLGQFKRGKSTLLNALVGEPVLPMGVVPVTTVPTIVRYGTQLSARVRFATGDWTRIAIHEVEEYVSEEKNPENSKRVAGLEVFVPSRLLASGMCFVDTPGLGSVFSGNSSATHAFIPHVDAALVVIGADPPLAGEELILVETVARHVNDLIVVLNKADRTTDAERSAAVAFALHQLEKKLNRKIGKILEVSASERFSGCGPDRDWPQLLETLERLDEGSGRTLIRSACARGRVRVSEQLLAIVAEERHALVRPIEESERRIATMKRTIVEAEQSMRELTYLFMAEQQHLSDIFVDRHKAFVAWSAPQADQQFQDAVRAVPRRFGPSYRRRVMHEAQAIARGFVVPWLRPEQEEAEKEYRGVALRFVEMGNAFLKKLADAGVPELARLPHALDAEAGFRVRSKFTFMDFIEVAEPASPLRWLADVAISLVGAHALIQKAGREFVNKLLVTNSTRVQSDILNRVQESRGCLEVEIRKLLHEVGRIAEQALGRARQVKEKGTPAVEMALHRLGILEHEIQALRGPVDESNLHSGQMV